MKLIVGVLQLIGFAAFFVAIDAWRTKRRFWSIATPARWVRHGVLGLLGLGALIGTMLATRVPLRALDSALGSGLLAWIRLPMLPRLIVGVALYDLTIYAAHRLHHEIPFLWRFHRVHHNDRAVDATTGWRHHPIAWCTDTAIRLVLSVLLGIPMASVGIYGLIQNLNGPFQHSTIVLPESLERWIRLVFITPSAHLIHHSRDVKQTNSNYAFVFSFWDRLFRTYSSPPAAGIVYGLDAFEDKCWDGLVKMLATPFVSVPREGSMSTVERVASADSTKMPPAA